MRWHDNFWYCSGNRAKQYIAAPMPFTVVSTPAEKKRANQERGLFRRDLSGICSCVNFGSEADRCKPITLTGVCDHAWCGFEFWGGSHHLRDLNTNSV